MSPGTAALRALRSQRLALVLLLAVAAMAAAGSALSPPTLPGAGVPTREGWSVARVIGARQTYSSPLFVSLLALLVVNVALCTAHRWTASGGRGTTLRRGTDLVLHASLILVLAGGALKGALGSVATKNVHVGGETAAMLDWGTGADKPLGFTLRVEEYREERLPARVALGVRDALSGRRVALLELTEGVPKPLSGSGLTLRVTGYDPASGAIGVEAEERAGRGQLYFGTRPGQETERVVGGQRLTLVAWRSDVRTVRARVAFIEGGRRVLEGWLDPNGPLRHRGTGFSLTGWGTDEFGAAYCGIQAVRDPGAPLFWAGCVLLVLAVPLHFAAKARKALD
jgi:hypothetical protein